MKIHDWVRFSAFLILFGFWLSIFIIGISNMNLENNNLIYSRREPGVGYYQYDLSLQKGQTYRVSIYQESNEIENSNYYINSSLVILIDNIVYLTDSWNESRVCDDEGCSNIYLTLIYDFKANSSSPMQILLNFTHGNVSEIKIYKNLPSNWEELKEFYIELMVMGLFSVIFLIVPLGEAGTNKPLYDKTKWEGLYIVMMFMILIIITMIPMQSLIINSKLLRDLHQAYFVYMVVYILFWLIRLIRAKRIPLTKEQIEERSKNKKYSLRSMFLEMVKSPSSILPIDIKQREICLDIIKKCLYKQNRKQYSEEFIKRLEYSYERKFLKQPETKTYGIVVDGIIIGTGSITTAGQIRDVFIDVNYQRKGYGKDIMIFLENVAKSQGNTQVFVYSAVGAIKFYQNLGYCQIEELRHSTMDIEIKMIKDLL